MYYSTTSIAAIALLLLISITRATQLFAQCDSNAQVQTSTYYAVVDGEVDSTISIPPNEIVPYYYFDSRQRESTIRYRIGEFVHGRNWVYLANWCEDAVHKLAPLGADTFTDAKVDGLLESRTKSFVVRAGDTISFYREFFWLNNTSNRVDPSSLVLDNNVGYTVELIHDVAQSKPFVVLDSIEFQSSSSSSPCISSWYPAMQRVLYVIPHNVTEPMPVFFNVRVHSNILSENDPLNQPYGSSLLRSDKLQVLLSKLHLEDPYWKEYAQQVSKNTRCDSKCQPHVNIRCSNNIIQLQVSGESAVKAVQVYNIRGELQVSSTWSMSTEKLIPMARKGVYVVVVVDVGGNEMCSQVVVVD